MNTNKRELKKVMMQIGGLLDPFVIAAIIFMLFVPALAVLNLSPKFQRNIDKKVLGVQNNTKLGVVLVGGTHNVVTNEGLDFSGENAFVYKATLQNREKGIYSKPILQLSNPGVEDMKLKVSLYSPMALSSDISLKYEGKTVTLINNVEATTAGTITIPPQKSYIVYLETSNNANIAFDQELELTITQ